MKMKNKKALVTGSGTGIGKGIAMEFARQGAKVALHYSQSADGALDAVREIQQFGGSAKTFRADFRQIEEVRELAQQATDFLGGLDVLVNNAGITLNLPFEEVTPEQFDVLYKVNVRAQFFLTQKAVPFLLKSTAGVIVNITSIHAFQGYPEHAVYAGTKGAIVSYTRELAVELAPKGIRVNAIAPGAVPVENHRKIGLEFDPEALGSMIPAGFAGTPEDIGRIAVFLASEDARFIIGQTIVADGGTTAWMPFSDAFRQPLKAQFGKGYIPEL